MAWYNRVIRMPSGESMNTGTPGVDAVQFIDQFLGPAQGKGRDVHDAAVGQGMVQGVCQGGQAVGPVFVVPLSVGGFHDQEIAGVGRVRVRDDGGVGAAQVSGKRDPVWGFVRFGKRKLDKAGPQDVTGVFQGKGDAVCQDEGVVQLKSPGQVVDLFFHGPDLGGGPVGKRHGIPEHGQKQGFGAVGADDLTTVTVLSRF